MIDVQREVRNKLWQEVKEIIHDVRSHNTLSHINWAVPSQVVLENSPVGESQSNGRVERAIKEVQAEVRIIKAQLEKRIGEALPPHGPVWAWLIEYAAQILHTYKRMKPDNKTARERIRGNPSTPAVAEFGSLWCCRTSKMLTTRRMNSCRPCNNELDPPRPR